MNQKWSHNRLLRIALLQRDYTAEDLPDVIGRSQSYVDARMCGRAPWSTDDCYAIMAWLGEPESRMHELFRPSRAMG